METFTFSIFYPIMNVMSFSFLAPVFTPPMSYVFNVALYSLSRSSISSNQTFTPYFSQSFCTSWNDNILRGHKFYFSSPLFSPDKALSIFVWLFRFARVDFIISPPPQHCWGRKNISWEVRDEGRTFIFLAYWFPLHCLTNLKLILFSDSSWPIISQSSLSPIGKWYFQSIFFHHVLLRSLIVPEILSLSLSPIEILSPLEILSLFLVLLVSLSFYLFLSTLLMPWHSKIVSSVYFPSSYHYNWFQI